jgi:hypothetical protein
MAGGLTPYVVAVCAMLFSGLSALTLFYAVRHFDPPETPRSPGRLERRTAA